jgi:hypothetical protein
MLLLAYKDLFLSILKFSEVYNVHVQNLWPIVIHYNVYNYYDIVNVLLAAQCYYPHSSQWIELLPDQVAS